MWVSSKWAVLKQGPVFPSIFPTYLDTLAILPKAGVLSPSTAPTLGVYGTLAHLLTLSPSVSL